MVDLIRATKPIPVIVGPNWQHVMAKAEIVRTPDALTVQIKIEGKGPESQVLADFLLANEVVALSFDGVPIKPHTAKG